MSKVVSDCCEAEIEKEVCKHCKKTVENVVIICGECGDINCVYHD